jgi:hypothetical protein
MVAVGDNQFVRSRIPHQQKWRKLLTVLDLLLILLDVRIAYTEKGKPRSSKNVLRLVFYDPGIAKSLHKTGGARLVEIHVPSVSSSLVSTPIILFRIGCLETLVNKNFDIDTAVEFTAFSVCVAGQWMRAAVADGNKNAPHRDVLNLIEITRHSGGTFLAELLIRFDAQCNWRRIPRFRSNTRQVTSRVWQDRQVPVWLHPSGPLNRGQRRHHSPIRSCSHRSPRRVDRQLRAPPRPPVG